MVGPSGSPVPDSELGEALSDSILRCTEYPRTNAASSVIDVTQPRNALKRSRNGLAGAAACEWGKKMQILFAQVVALVRETGMRNERELYRVRIEHIDLRGKVLFVPDSKTPDGRRSIPLSDRAIAILKRRCGTQTTGWLFPSKRSKCGHLTTLGHRFREARKKAGLPKELVLYCGRHDFGTRILTKTGNLKLVMLTTGHKNVGTAMKYQHPELEIVRAALNGNGAAATQQSA